MNKYKTWSQIFIVVAIISIFAFDAFVFLRGGQEATISSVIITEWTKDYPAFTFFVGFIMGHLFWPLSTNKFKGVK